jgi:adenine-specific DNA-methyltransferase
MPTLDWIGKRAVVSHHHEVPFHLLRCREDLSVGEPGSGNLLIQGDNLLALKALLPYYAGKVKCIYIDPPYNTGDESWVYNDNVNSPEMQHWLGEVVGREGDDLSRHDKWLCMMFPRLSLLWQFLRPDGVLFVSIDDGEFASLKLLLDEVFDPRNFLGTLVWKRRSSTAMRGTPLSIDHEYVFAYGRDVRQTTLYGLEQGIEAYPLEDERGHYASTDLTVGMGRDARPGQFYPIANPRTGVVYEPNPERVWRFFPETMRKVIEEDLIIWPDESEGRMTRPRYKTYFDPSRTRPKPVSSWIESLGHATEELDAEEDEYEISILMSGMNQEGGRVLQRIMGTKAFAYPKPVSLVTTLVRASTRRDDIIMDSFAGSGTTGHAVLALDALDDARRRFLLVEMEAEIAQSLTRERLRRVAEGYEWTDVRGNMRTGKGLGGSFRYCELGPTLFDASGQIRGEVAYGDLARHVFFVETGEPLPEATQPTWPLLGVAGGTGVYLLYNGVLRDKSVDGGNVLTRALMAALPAHEGPKVIYGTGCRISEHRLRQLSVIFRQIPYQVRTA